MKTPIALAQRFCISRYYTACDPLDRNVPGGELSLLAFERPLIINAAVALVVFCLAFASIAARASPQEDQQACINDALTVCSQFVPDRERVANCLLSNRSRISQTCRMALAHFNQKVASPAKLTADR